MISILRFSIFINAIPSHCTSSSLSRCSLMISVLSDPKSVPESKDGGIHIFSATFVLFRLKQKPKLKVFQLLSCMKHFHLKTLIIIHSWTMIDKDYNFLNLTSLRVFHFKSQLKDQQKGITKNSIELLLKIGKIPH